MPDKPMSRRDVEDLVKLTSLEFTNVMTKKLDDFADKQKEEHRLSREQAFEQGTGYPWEHRGKVKSIIAWACRAKETSSLWRNAGIIAFIGLSIKTFWKDITG